MEGLKVIESGIIPIYEDTAERKLINARELHEFLESKQEFAHWIRGRIEKYGFISDEDYLIILSNRVGDGVGKPKTDYLLKIGTAKELAMVENNDKGRLIRKYFIECERRLQAANCVINMKAAEKLRQQAKLLDIMDRNSRNRQAHILKSSAEFFKDILADVSMQAIASEITVLTTGSRLIDPPETEKLYSATEVGEICGISANMVGRVANKLGLKIAEYGMFLLSQSPHNRLKQVTVFHYKRKAADKIREFLDAARKIPVEESPLGEFDLSAAYL
jgi:phage anti-repressor protein